MKRKLNTKKTNLGTRVEFKLVLLFFPLVIRFFFYCFRLFKAIFYKRICGSNSKKNVAIISSTAPPRISGGVSSAHFNLYKKLKYKGFNVKIFTFFEGNQKNNKSDVIRHGINSDFVRKLVEKTAKWAFIYFSIKEHGKSSYHLSTILKSAFSTIKINASLYKFHPDYIVFPDHGSPASFIKKPKNCITLFISHHNSMRFVENPFFANLSKMDAKWAVDIENKGLRIIDKVICPSKYMLDVFENTYKYTGEKFVVHNVVDNFLLESIPKNDIRSEIELQSDSVLIYIPSASSIYKGSSYVCSIIEKISTLIGDRKIGFYLSGEMEIEFQRKISQLASDNIKIYFPGWLSYNDNISIIKSCSFSISPTLIENFSMAILEACFCGVPVITFDTGGNKEIIKDDENGYIVPYLDVDKMVQKSVELICGNNLLELKRKSIEYTNRTFNSEIIVDEFIRVMQK